MKLAGDIWSEDLTDAQLSMVMESGENARLGGKEGFGVELNGAGKWATARSLERLGLGVIDGGAPNGSNLPGLYFNNEEGIRITHEFDDFADEPDWVPVYGEPKHLYIFPLRQKWATISRQQGWQAQPFPKPNAARLLDAPVPAGASEARTLGAAPSQRETA